MIRPIARSLLLAAALLSGNVATLSAEDGKGGRAPVEDNPSVDRLINDFRNGDNDKKHAALRALERLGPKAKAAVPDLIAALSSKEPGIRIGAVYALRAIGPDAREALPALRLVLREALKDDWGNASVAGAIVLISQTIDLETTRVLVAGNTPKSGQSLIIDYLGLHSAELVPHLIVLLDDMSAQVRERAAYCFWLMSRAEQGQDSLLKKMGDKGKPIAPALVKHLDDPDIAAATAIAKALTHVDAELGLKAIPTVVNWLKRAEKGFNEYAAVEILKPVAKPAIPQLIEALDNKDKGVRYSIAATVAQLPDAIEPIIKALQHEKPFIRAGAAQAIASKHQATSNQTAALVVALKDPEYVVRFAVADALVSLPSGDKMSEAVPVLLEVIGSGSEEEQTRAVHLLTRVGPAAKSAVPTLVKLLEDKRFSVRFEAALALTAIDEVERVKAVPVLIEGTESKVNTRQHQAAKSLALIGPPAKAAIPALEKLFTANYIHTRYCAAEAVALIDPSKTEAAVKVLVATLDDKKGQGMVRAYVLTALRKIGPAAKAALPRLNELLKDDDGPFVAEAAMTAICLVGDEAKEARAFLREHLSKASVDEYAYDFVDVFPQVVGGRARLFMNEVRMVFENAKNHNFQEHMCDSIADLGPAGKDLEPLLKEVISKSKRESTVKAAEKALKAITNK